MRLCLMWLRGFQPGNSRRCVTLASKAYVRGSAKVGDKLVRRDFVATGLLVGGAWALTQLAGVALATLGEVVHKGAVVEVASQFAVNIVLGSLSAVVTSRAAPR